MTGTARRVSVPLSQRERARERVKPWQLLPVMVIVTVVAIAACSSPEPTSTPIPPTATATATATSPTATPAVFATSTPRPPDPDGLNRGGVLRLAFSERPPHNDPHLSSAPSVITWGPAMAYSRLFRLQSTAETPAPSRFVECELCETWRFTNLTTLEIKLREEAAWQDIAPLDGRQVTADDVVFSLNRIRTPGYANASLLTNVETVSAPGTRTVLITLKTPDSETLEKLAHAAVRIVAPEVVEKEGDLRDGPVVGSGPWVFEEISPTALTLEANRVYWEEGLPFLDGLAIQYIADADTRQSAVRTGFLDADHTTPALVRAALDRFREFGAAFTRQPDQGAELAINTNRAPLDSLEFRQAIFLSWDPRAIIDDVWDGDAFVSLGLSPPTPRWLDDEAAYFDDVFADRQAALDLLDDIDLTGVSLTIRVGDFSDRYRAHGEALAAAMNDVGIPTEVEVVTTRVFGDEVWLGGNYDIMVGAPAPVSGLTARLFSVHHSDGPWNTTGYGTDELDTLIEQQASAYTPQQRRPSYVQIAEAIIAGRHRFNSAAAITAWMWRPNVRNFNPDIQLGDTSFLLHTWLDR